jgi:two-component system, NarL family, nitrate/nitrite response regulator NarL
MDSVSPVIQILIADDQPIFREGVRRVLAREVKFQVVGEAVDGEETVKLVRQVKPDILLLDLSMPRRSGMDALRELFAVTSPVRTILLSVAIEPVQVVEALQLGARGFLLKNAAAELLLKSIHTVMAGQYWLGRESIADLMQALRHLSAEGVGVAPEKTFGLTRRELEIVAAIVGGYTNRQVAEKFAISEDTVKRHLSHIFDKLGVFSRLELALFALNNRLVGHPE